MSFLVKIQLERFTTLISKLVRVFGTIPVMSITEAWFLRREGEGVLREHRQRKIIRRRRKKMGPKRTRQWMGH